MLTCVYSAESFKTKAVTVKLRQAGGKAKKKAKLLAIKERPGVAKPDPTVNANHGTCKECCNFVGKGRELIIGKNSLEFHQQSGAVEACWAHNPEVFCGTPWLAVVCDETSSTLKFHTLVDVAP
ncbi:hypothetical protein KQX54_004328 [Cotesia glomerata]|uniref:Uncharacterized protein n=1 Tax=Cotesia glomerata TaxID=32391 RepID=A0AAV7IM47_COTGL|nr:hypothetical protein KQX54_004328 [Cotesia glomerata]